MPKLINRSTRSGHWHWYKANKPIRPTHSLDQVQPARTKSSDGPCSPTTTSSTTDLALNEIKHTVCTREHHAAKLMATAGVPSMMASHSNPAEYQSPYHHHHYHHPGDNGTAQLRKHPTRTDRGHQQSRTFQHTKWVWVTLLHPWPWWTLKISSHNPLWTIEKDNQQNKQLLTIETTWMKSNPRWAEYFTGKRTRIRKTDYRRERNLSTTVQLKISINPNPDTIATPIEYQAYSRTKLLPTRPAITTKFMVEFEIGELENLAVVDHGDRIPSHWSVCSISFYWVLSHDSPITGKLYRHTISFHSKR